MAVRDYYANFASRPIGDSGSPRKRTSMLTDEIAVAGRFQRQEWEHEVAAPSTTRSKQSATRPRLLAACARCCSPGAPIKAMTNPYSICNLRTSSATRPIRAYMPGQLWQPRVALLHDWGATAEAAEKDQRARTSSNVRKMRMHSA